MRRHRNLALAAVACLVAGCGGGQTEAAKIADVIKHGLATTNPADCTGLMTHAYLLQNHLGTDQTVLRMCTQDLRDPTGNPRSVDVVGVRIAGPLATANAAIHGGDLDGQTLRLRLRNDGGRWRLDRIEAFAIFNRAKFLAGVMTDFSSGSGALSRPLASCVVGRMDALDDARLEAIELGDDHTPLLRLVTGCARSARTRLPAA